MKAIPRLLALSFASALLLPLTANAAGKKLKVFILAGQSNMEGHARIETFDYIGDDPATAPLLKMMRGADGNPTTADNAWISLYTGHYEGKNNGEAHGKLTSGYGARGSNFAKDGGKIGPEFTFGLFMDKHFDEPVLIIKTAWGGRSLNTQYRPPSAGPYVFSEAQIENMKKKEKDVEAEKKAKAEECGRFYGYMIEHVKNVLADPKRVVPDYDPAAGFELAGFVWFQGFNDLVDSGTYPLADPENRQSRVKDYSEYSRLMACFIRDVRKDLNAPKMPFVIGVLGVGGTKAKEGAVAFRKAMAAPAALPEFKGNVMAVETAPFWSDELEAIDQKRFKVKQMAHLLRVKNKNTPNADGSMDAAAQKAYLKEFEAELISEAEATMWKRGASNAGYHYMGCAKTFALMGKAFAEANLKMLGE